MCHCICIHAAQRKRTVIENLFIFFLSFLPPSLLLLAFDRIDLSLNPLNFYFALSTSIMLLVCPLKKSRNRFAIGIYHAQRKRSRDPSNAIHFPADCKSFCPHPSRVGVSEPQKGEKPPERRISGERASFLRETESESHTELCKSGGINKNNPESVTENF